MKYNLNKEDLIESNKRLIEKYQNGRETIKKLNLIFFLVFTSLIFMGFLINSKLSKIEKNQEKEINVNIKRHITEACGRKGGSLQITEGNYNFNCN